MALVDEETRQIILKKTWCHGQLVLPGFSLFYLYIFLGGVGQQHRFNWVFLYASLVFPLWSYVSYTTISGGTRSYALRPLVVGGIGVQMAHLGILISVVKASTTLDMLLLIASSLFLVETTAFLCVAWKLRPAGEDESDILQGQERIGIASGSYA